MLILRLPYGNPTDCTKRTIYVYVSPREIQSRRLPPDLKPCIIEKDPGLGSSRQENDGANRL
jgi:hypothetical protein